MEDISQMDDLTDPYTEDLIDPFGESTPTITHAFKSLVMSCIACICRLCLNTAGVFLWGRINIKVQ